MRTETTEERNSAGETFGQILVPEKPTHGGASALITPTSASSAWKSRERAWKKWNCQRTRVGNVCFACANQMNRTQTNTSRWSSPFPTTNVCHLLYISPLNVRIRLYASLNLCLIDKWNCSRRRIACLWLCTVNIFNIIEKNYIVCSIGQCRLRMFMNISALRIFISVRERACCRRLWNWIWTGRSAACAFDVRRRPDYGL